MAKIEIEWLADSSECETCSGGYAEGAIIKIDGKVVIDLEPVATCFGGDSYDQDEVYRRLLGYLGHELVIVGEAD